MELLVGDRRKTERRRKQTRLCECGHYPSQHENIWDGEVGKSFWFCHGCEREGRKFPETHHKPKADAHAD